MEAQTVTRSRDFTTNSSFKIGPQQRYIPNLMGTSQGFDQEWRAFFSGAQLRNPFELQRPTRASAHLAALVNRPDVLVDPVYTRRPNDNSQISFLYLPGARLTVTTGSMEPCTGYIEFRLNFRSILTNYLFNFDSQDPNAWTFELTIPHTMELLGNAIVENLRIDKTSHSFANLVFRQAFRTLKRLPQVRYSLQVIISVNAQDIDVNKPETGDFVMNAFVGLTTYTLTRLALR